MQRGRAPRRDYNNRVVFERLWRGTFQAVVAGPQRPARASSLEPAIPGAPQGPPRPDPLEPALRTILEGLRSSCCCRCNCSAIAQNSNDNLQVCLPAGEEKKSVRSVIRCAYSFIDFIVRNLGRTPPAAVASTSIRTYTFAYNPR